MMGFNKRQRLCEKGVFFAMVLEISIFDGSLSNDFLKSIPTLDMGIEKALLLVRWYIGWHL